MKELILTAAVQQLLREAHIIHTSRYAFNRDTMPLEYHSFRYTHIDVLSIIRESNLDTAYVIWKSTANPEKSILPVRTVNDIMHRNQVHLVVSHKFITELVLLGDRTGFGALLLFQEVIRLVIPGFFCNEAVMYGMLNIMKEKGFRIA